MPGSHGTPIARQALSLQSANPDWTALQVLDHALEPHRGTHPDFETDDVDYHDLLEPPSAFAEVLRAAFDPSLTQEDLQLMVTHDVEPQQRAHQADVCERWQKVVDAFAARHELWE